MRSDGSVAKPDVIDTNVPCDIIVKDMCGIQSLFSSD